MRIKFLWRDFSQCNKSGAGARAIRGTQEENVSIIINIGQGVSKHSDGEIISGIIRMLTARATVLVVLNLDHGKDYERITHAFHHGFSPIMIDGSEYPLEENISCSKEVVMLCHSQNVMVEGEIGLLLKRLTPIKKLDLFTLVKDVVHFFSKSTASLRQLLPQGLRTVNILTPCSQN